MSQQTYTAIQLSIICVLTFLVATVAVWQHPEWFGDGARGTAAVAHGQDHRPN
jgi:hypothetical protein